jgi:hypothetical protein
VFDDQLLKIVIEQEWEENLRENKINKIKNIFFSYLLFDDFLIDIRGDFSTVELKTFRN